MEWAFHSNVSSIRIFLKRETMVELVLPMKGALKGITLVTELAIIYSDLQKYWQPCISFGKMWL
jgi:hypothetical protein